MLAAAVQGFVTGGGLIVAIGAQNAFILRKGLLRQHVFILCLVAAISDAVLIALGVAGFGTLVRQNPTVLLLITVAGALFLAAYALFALQRALRPSVMEAAQNIQPSLRGALLTLFAFTFLNPHVYLDTVLLVGGISAQFAEPQRTAFGVGAMTASFVWFFSLGYGARWLEPVFRKPSAWRVLDALIAIIMALLSLSLFLSAWSQYATP
ncbi:MAG: LysE/ArgO family amino acid transporter [Pseudomonadota bacterium]